MVMQTSNSGRLSVVHYDYKEILCAQIRLRFTRLLSESVLLGRLKPE